MNVRMRSAWRWLSLVLVVLVCQSFAHAVLINNGGNGVIVFGVADYGGGPVAGNPTYINNNFTGLNDILTSPGGGFQTADTSIGNNIFQVGPGPLPGFGWKIGGGNGNGNFGTGYVNITGPAVGFTITDANPDGAGAASYEIASWNQTYLNVGVLNNVSYGSWLAISGQLASNFGAAAVSLRTTINDTMGTFNNVVLPELVLAFAGDGLGGWTSVSLGGLGGGNAAVIHDGFGGFQGIAINNMGLANIPDGDLITVTSTLTVIADPSTFDAIDQPDGALIGLTGTTIPEFGPGLTAVPEPASLMLIALGSLAVLGRRRRAA